MTGAPSRSAATHPHLRQPDAFEAQLLSLIPQLRGFARTFRAQPADADDLVQEAVAKALQSRAHFTPGTNMRAWTFTILRNILVSQKRRAWRSTQLEPGHAENSLVAADDPEAPIRLDELRQALAMLPDLQREALIMISCAELSYEEVAQIVGAPVGTVKSRVSRARIALAEIIERGEFDRDGQPASLAMACILSMVPKGNA